MARAALQLEAVEERSRAKEFARSWALAQR
jgi:hypothetical protein